MSRKTPIWIIALILVLNLAWLPNGRASADMGPKPELDFYFSLPGDLRIEDARMLQCWDSACQDVETHFWGAEPDCKGSHCYTVVFSTGGTYQLQVLFSDGQTRLSDPFRCDHIHNVYTVSVQETELAVRLHTILSYDLNAFTILYFVLIVPIGLVILIILAIVLSAEKRAKTRHPDKKHTGFRIAAWVLAGLLALVGVAMGTLATWALPVNLLIELFVADVYWRFYWPKKKDWVDSASGTVQTHTYTLENRPRWLPLMGSVVVVNLISQPLLWIIAAMASAFWGVPLILIVLLLEVGVWLLEAAMLRLLLTQHLCWRDALQLSLFMNLVSFGIGLFLAL